MGKKAYGKAGRTNVPEAEQRALERIHRSSDFRPEYVEKVQQLCNLGVTERDLCVIFGVSHNTVANWKKMYPDFFVGLLKGKQVADTEVADSLFKAANGYDYYEEVAVKLRNVTGYEEGKPVVEERVEVVRIKKHKPAEVTAQIFWLKNRRPELWRDAKQIEAGPEFLKATMSGDPVLKALQEKGFVELDGEFEVVGAGETNSVEEDKR